MHYDIQDYDPPERGELAEQPDLLHGRTAFPTSQPRRMNRLNFDGTGPFGRYLSFGIIPEYSELRQAA